MRRDASEVLEAFVRDKIDAMVTVSEVDVSDDLKYAKIYYTVLGDDENLIHRVDTILQKATGYLQTEIARRIRIRRMPEISLHYDSSLVEGLRMTRLIDEVMSEDNEPEQ